MDDLKGIWNTLKLIKYKSPQPKFCPSCKGYNIFPLSALGVLPTKYRCKDCGYEGILVLELERNED